MRHKYTCLVMTLLVMLAVIHCHFDPLGTQHPTNSSQNGGLSHSLCDPRPGPRTPSTPVLTTSTALSWMTQVLLELSLKSK